MKGYIKKLQSTSWYTKEVEFVVSVRNSKLLIEHAGKIVIIYLTPTPIK